MDGNKTAKPPAAQKGKLEEALLATLGYCMVAGGTMYKVPQILSIQKARSAGGISLTSSALALTSSTVGMAYSMSERHPLSTYGELIPASVCSWIILLQCLHYQRKATGSQLAAIGGAGFCATVALCRASRLVGERLASSIIQKLQSTVPLFVMIEKVPQLLDNWRAKSTGELVVSTASLAVVGALIRVYTTVRQLSEDRIAQLPHFASLATNFALLLQILAYGRNAPSG
eukprot:TRINITY_DN55785_c0_g1_i1.p1 TRINITY_DN55785_c0_g1~~TRINITY_DN55785_c0_g1_i1.p1  ORF type:complete len:258 (-),score=25.07 TRINITY_DN55785_c0_g1_i1:30-719(-)